MLAELHNALRQLIHERGNIDPAEVEMLFDAPERARVDRLIRPAVSLFLTGIEENIELRNASFDSTRAANSVERKMAPRRIDLTYLVSALTTVADDEHHLLWRVLATLLRHQQLPVEYLPEEITRTGVPVTLRTAQPDDSGAAAEIWSGLNLRPRAAFSCIVTVPLDLEIAIQAPLVLTRTARYHAGVEDGASVVSSYLTIGGVVRGKEGDPVAGATVRVQGRAGLETLSGADGAYTLANVPDGPLTLEVAHADYPSRSVEISVPSDSYDIDLG